MWVDTWTEWNIMPVVVGAVWIVAGLCQWINSYMSNEDDESDNNE